MSILTIAQNITAEAGIEIPDSVVGSEDEGAVRVRALIRREGLNLARRQDWVVLQRVHTFTTVPNQAAYDLPDDFDRLLDQTVWDRTNFWQARGPLTPQQWQWRKSSSVPISQMREHFRIFQHPKQFFLEPVPTAAYDFVFEYISNGLYENSDSTITTEFKSDTSEPLLDSELIELGGLWRLLNRLGLEYIEERYTYEQALDKAMARDGGARLIDLKGFPKRFVPNIPEGNFGSP